MDALTRATALCWLQAGRPAVVVTVLDARGSTPRDSGTRMVVAGDAAVGTIGGGHLEAKAIADARELLRSGAGSQRVHVALGPSLGQCCGGALTLAFDRLDEHALAAWPEPLPLFHLQMYGAGHVGAAIARLLATIDCRVQWIDERDDVFPCGLFGGAAWPRHVERVSVDAVEGEVRVAPRGAFYLVLTHDHDLDLRITEAILRRGDFAYLGLIGSKTKRARFVRRFEDRGVPTAAIARMTCPIGVPEIESKEPELLAVGVVAQLVGVAGAALAGDRALGLPADAAAPVI